MAREAVCANNERFILQAARNDLRIDGRGMNDMRAAFLRIGPKDGLVEAVLGSETRVLADVTAELGSPPPDRPNEGSVSIHCEVAHTADGSFEAGRGQPQASSSAPVLSRVLEKSLLHSGAIDKEALCVKTGTHAWSLRCDVKVIDGCGGLFGACGLAALAAFASFRRPDVSVHHETGMVELHSAESVEPLPLSLHHYPFVFEFACISMTDEPDELSSCVLLDPTHEEEAAASCHAVVSANAFEELCAVHKPGQRAIAEREMRKCTRVSLGHVQELTEMLKHELSRHEQWRIESRVRRRDPSKISARVPASSDRAKQPQAPGDNLVQKEYDMAMPMNSNQHDSQVKRLWRHPSKDAGAHEDDDESFEDGEKQNHSSGSGIADNGAKARSTAEQETHQTGAATDPPTTEAGGKEHGTEAPVVNSLADALKNSNDEANRKSRRERSTNR